MSAQPISNPAAPEAVTQALRVRVRMYRPGLGDCFLISFFQGAAEHHVLIDCGVYQATKDAKATMQKIAQHIRETTKNRLDLVAATHEHWDHLSGFQQAQEVFDKIAMKQVWLAWTEDPANPLANQLREERSLALRTLQAAARFMPGDMAIQGQIVQGLLDFFGGETPAATTASPARQVLDYLASRKDAIVSYCQPGEPPRSLDGLPGVRFFVLGPPTSEALLKKTEPGKRAHEGYGLSDQMALVSSISNAIEHLQGSPPESPGNEQDFPFDLQFRVTLEHASQDPFFIEHYGFGAQQGDAWRRIDRDWLGIASDLALRLDQATNNTSLVLAIELVESGQVLLFTGDAQAGNWLSWKEVSWDLPTSDGGSKTVTGGDLVARTTLYKVGHHGSHNATLRESGLERMQSADLVALLPVQQTMAEQQNWSMPFPPLYRRLQEKTRGRLARLDYGIPASAPLAENGLALLTQAEWKAFRHKTAEHPLYIDYMLE